MIKTILLYIIVLLCSTWSKSNSQAKGIALSSDCFDGNCQDLKNQPDLFYTDDAKYILNKKIFTHEDSNIQSRNVVDIILRPHEPVYHSTRDEKIQMGKIATLRSNDENVMFVPLVNVSVESWIHLFSADVTLIQTFINRENKPIEAIYVFPIEENGAIYSMTAQIDDRIITAQIKQKEDAEKEYQEAVQQGQTATLLRQSQDKLDVFTINVGNLPPGKQCQIKIQYVTELDLINRQSIRFVVPSTIAPRYDPQLKQIQSPDKTDSKYVQNTPYSISFDIHVLPDGIYQVSNLSHPVNVSKSSQLINLSTKSVALDRDFIIDIHLLENSPSMLNAVEQYQANKYAILTALIPDELIKSNVLKSELILMVDCSGSMMSESKINLAREAVLRFIEILPVDSYFNIIRFGSNYEILFKNEVAVIYNEKTGEIAKNLVRTMEANLGGTELLEPLHYLKNHPPVNERSRQIFLLTDGEISNTDEAIKLCQSMSSTTRIFSFGLGHSPSRSLVKGLARATNGHFEFIPPGDKVDIYVETQLRRSLKPAIVNAYLRWNGLPSNIEQSPNVLPPLFADDRTFVYTLFESDQLEQQTIHVDFITKEKLLDSSSFSLGKTSHKGDGIRRLAAKAMIQHLQHKSDENFDNKDKNNSSKQKIIALSLNHSILCPYTAFVGVETKNTTNNLTGLPEVRHVPIQITKDDEHLFISRVFLHVNASSSRFSSFTLTCILLIALLTFTSLF